MTDDQNQSPHEVLVKVIQHRDITEDQRSEESQRIGDVLLVIAREPMAKAPPEIDDPSAVYSRPDLAPTVVKVVTSDPTLNGCADERVIKRSRIGSTVLETIRVGMCMPA